MRGMSDTKEIAMIGNHFHSLTHLFRHEFAFDDFCITRVPSLVTNGDHQQQHQQQELDDHLDGGT